MEPIDYWILENSEKIQLKVTEYLWPAEYYPGHSDLSAEITIDEKSFIGRGSDIDINIATRKAVVEALERACAFFDGKRGSNGIAAHPIEIIATRNACFELIERDAFLCHFLTTTSFKKVPPSSLAFNSSENKLIEKISAAGVVLHHHFLINSSDAVGTITFAMGENCTVPWGMCFGMSVKGNLQESLSKSLLECVRHVIPLLKSTSIETIKEIEFLTQKEISVENHFKLGLDLEYAYWFKNTFLKCPGDDDALIQEIPAIKTIELRDLIEKLQIPLYCILADSSELQSLFFGKTENPSINFERLERFLKSQKLDSTNFNYRPHPIC